MSEALLQCQVGDYALIFRVTYWFAFDSQGKRFSVEYFVEYALQFKFISRVFEE